MIWEYKYKTLKELKQALDEGKHPDCEVVVDNDSVKAIVEYYDKEGEVIQDPVPQLTSVSYLAGVFRS